MSGRARRTRVYARVPRCSLLPRGLPRGPRTGRGRCGGGGGGLPGSTRRPSLLSRRPCPPRAAGPSRASPFLPFPRRGRAAARPRGRVVRAVSLWLPPRSPPPAAFPRLGTSGGPASISPRASGPWGIRVWRDRLTSLSGLAFGERWLFASRRCRWTCVGAPLPLGGLRRWWRRWRPLSCCVFSGTPRGPSFSGRLGAEGSAGLPQEAWWGGTVPVVWPRVAQSFPGAVGLLGPG